MGCQTWILLSGAGNVPSASTLNSTAGETNSLLVNTSGTTRFNGAVGLTDRLSSLTTDAGGTTVINGGTVNTTGAQTYNDPVLLGTATTLAANLAANHAFPSPRNPMPAVTSN